jgi:lactobin A/cerein 7B family class IIb bacteriocin
MEKIMCKTDRRTKIMDAQQTSEVRELTDAELDSVNGGSSPSLLEVAAGMVITAVGELWIPLIRAGVL